MTSLEYKVESLFIAILSGSVPGVEFRHFDDSAPAKLNVITVRAIQGRQILEGSKPFEVEVTMTSRSEARLNSSDIFGDNAGEGMRKIFETTFNQYPGALAPFSVMNVLPDAVGDRSNEKYDRDRQYKVNVEAKLA